MTATPDLEPIPRGPFWLGRFIRATAPAWLGLSALETRVLRRRLQPVDRPIYILGLPRAGTTITLEMVSRHPESASHRHVDFPNLFTPYLWNSFVSRLGLEKETPHERLHRDGLMVTALSPEAGEESLWTRFIPGLHAEDRSVVLTRDDHHPRFESFYRDHIRKLLLVRGRRRYVAKGNYNVTRLAYILKMFPDARFLLLVRHPFHQVASLLKQDRLFTRLFANDSRWGEITTSIGHYSFGPAKKWVRVGDGDTVAEIHRLLAANREARAWAVYWSSIYGFVADQLAADPALAAATTVIRYEDLVDHPGPTIDSILEHTALDPRPYSELRAHYLQKLKAPDYYRPSFTADELADITDATATTAARFGYARQSFTGLSASA